MSSDYFETAIKALSDQGVECAAGLTAAEIGPAEARYRFRFPPDLRAFLEHVLPSASAFRIGVLEDRSSSAMDWRGPPTACASKSNTTPSGCPHGDQGPTRWRRPKRRLAKPCAWRRSCIA